MNVRLFHKQILHSKHACFPNEELGSGKGTQSKALSVKCLMSERDLVGRRLGHNAVDAVYLAFACHLNI